VQAKQDLEEKVAKYDPNNDAVIEVRKQQEWQRYRYTSSSATDTTALAAAAAAAVPQTQRGSGSSSSSATETAAVAAAAARMRQQLHFLESDPQTAFKAAGARCSDERARGHLCIVQLGLGSGCWFVHALAV
jgi:hypothetical protein